MQVLILVKPARIESLVSLLSPPARPWSVPSPHTTPATVASGWPSIGPCWPGHSAEGEAARGDWTTRARLLTPLAAVLSSFSVVFGGRVAPFSAAHQHPWAKYEGAPLSLVLSPQSSFPLSSSLFSLSLWFTFLRLGASFVEPFFLLGLTASFFARFAREEHDTRYYEKGDSSLPGCLGRVCQYDS